jgi:DNA adenine methylase
MKYMGSKNKISMQIKEIIDLNRHPDQYYVEPMVGGANMMDKMKGKRIGADVNEYLIAALTLIRDVPESIPELITENDYNEYKHKLNIDGITGFVGFAMSFGGKFFGGYRRDKKGSEGCIKNMKTQSRRARESAIIQSNNLQGVELVSSGFKDLKIPPKSVIYCDIPYINTTSYAVNSFDHLDFYMWAESKSKEGHKVFISEYWMPEDRFTKIWSEAVNCGMSDGGAQRKIESLFIPKGQKIFIQKTLF